ncbi:putative membrane protein YesL [Pseudonocardia hierapolitana]|uniref:Putative membrane protein YesL n=1 Tax=Pseudonocardia hierapolitana TaxID=1128676 RepID=A0A561SK15_9PSEU|nr:hypothetical protein [Pseudonocardia hierapolitana]TWF75218.1 putative membrane protein YesL [Pseudonocardia hierapolitana]
MPTAAREYVSFENVFEPHRSAGTAVARRFLGLVALAGLWALCTVPVVTWLAASAALVHALDGGTRSPTEALHAFREGWRRHRRRTVALGTLSLLVPAVLATNLLFLSTQGVGLAVVLAAGTVVLMLISTAMQLALVPVIVLFPAAGPRRWLQAAFVVAFRDPVRSACLVIVTAALVAATSALSPLLVPLCAPVVGHLAMRACLRQVVTGPGGTPALR